MRQQAGDLPSAGLDIPMALGETALGQGLEVAAGRLLRWEAVIGPGADRLPGPRPGCGRAVVA